MTNKSKLDAVEFGTQLINSLDLDPVYVILYEANLEFEDLCRWLISYWCYYDVGSASILSENKHDFFEELYDSVEGTTFRRGSERRHFRGSQGKASVLSLELKNMSPVQLVESLFPEDHKASTAMLNVKKWRGFGDWIAFKVADMLERLELTTIVFEQEDIFSMFDSPVKGAELLYKEEGLVGDPIPSAISFLRKNLNSIKAPPTNNRLIDFQEIETVLCKWKSHFNGRYTIGNDINECKHSLQTCSSKVAKHLLNSSIGVLW